MSGGVLGRDEDAVARIHGPGDLDRVLVPRFEPVGDEIEHGGNSMKGLRLGILRQREVHDLVVKAARPCRQVAATPRVDLIRRTTSTFSSDIAHAVSLERSSAFMRS